MTETKVPNSRSRVPAILPEEAKQNIHLYPSDTQRRIREELAKMRK